MIHGPDDRREFTYLMEDIGDGYVTVMLPRAPTPMAGSIKLVPMSQVEVLEVSLSEPAAVITHWGVGSGALVQRNG